MIEPGLTSQHLAHNEWGKSYDELDLCQKLFLTAKVLEIVKLKREDQGPDIHFLSGSTLQSRRFCRGHAFNGSTHKRVLSIYMLKTLPAPSRHLSL